MNSSPTPVKRTAPPVMLTVAGFDPSSGAGITADLLVFSAFGGFGVSCITGLTVQSTTGVAGIEPVASRVVQETLRVLAEDLPLAGVKIGMISTAANARVLDDFCAANRGIPTVFDPVWKSSSGRALLDEAGADFLHKKIFKNLAWITPNLDELGLLTGIFVKTAEDVPAAAKKLRARAAEQGNPGLHVVVTGGHLESNADFLVCEGMEAWIPGKRVETSSTHGTGCAFSSALLAGLVMQPERTPVEQVAAAKAYVRRALETAVPMGKGRGPMNLLWPVRTGKSF
jgi:hydroxymethylpyrimidine/phosphomethylpyrimidine kinase